MPAAGSPPLSWGAAEPFTDPSPHQSLLHRNTRPTRPPAAAALLRWRAGTHPAPSPKCRAVRGGRSQGEGLGGSCSPSPPTRRSAQPSRAPDYISQGALREHRSSEQGKMAAAARGCGGVWRRAWQRGAGGPAPAPRGQRAVACNARGGAVPAGKSGYGAGTVRGEGPVEVVLRWGIPPLGRGRRVGAGPGFGPLGLGRRATAAGAGRRRRVGSWRCSYCVTRRSQGGSSRARFKYHLLSAVRHLQITDGWRHLLTTHLSHTHPKTPQNSICLRSTAVVPLTRLAVVRFPHNASKSETVSFHMFRV